MTADQLLKKMERRKVRLETEFKATMRGVAVSALKFTKEKLTTEVYAIPEDRTKAGKKKWRRTGHLRRSEKFEVRGPYAVAIVNTASYAVPRHEAGKPGHRNINPARISHWRDDMKEAFHEGLLQDLYRQTLLDVLKAE